MLIVEEAAKSVSRCAGASTHTGTDEGRINCARRVGICEICGTLHQPWEVSDRFTVLPSPAPGLQEARLDRPSNSPPAPKEECSWSPAPRP